MSTSNDDKDDDQTCNTCGASCPDPNETLYGKPVFQDPGAGQGYD